MKDWVDTDLFRWWMRLLVASPIIVIVWLMIDLWMSR